MQTKAVIVGAEHWCSNCDRRIPRGTKAYRKRRRAETHRERLHADQKGQVSWYLCVACGS